MATIGALEEGIGLIWEELQGLVGDKWSEIEADLLVLLRRLDSGEDSLDVQNSIAALFEQYPEAWQRLVIVMADLVLDQQKGAPPPLSVRRDRHLVLPLYYATDRAETDDENPARRYGTERGDLAFGIAHVSIPDDHRMGKLEKPRWWQLEFRPNPNKHVVLLAVEPLSREQFITQATYAGEQARADAPEALVFIHGYNVSFEDAACRAAQLAYDLGFTGIPMLYSWPSAESVAKYTIDETNVRWSQEHFREFITLCRTELAVRTVHLVAHSMGSRLLAEALPNLERVAGAAMLRQVVFAAPDIDADTFRQLAAAFHRQAERCTLYASSKDYALQASKAFHGNARAGDSGANLVFVADIDTVDATEVDTSLLGHSFYGDNRSILSDLFTLVRDGHGPAQRFGLRELKRGGMSYWEFQP